MISASTNENWPEKWESVCNFDLFRNEIVIPKLTKIISDEKPITVADLGCGTGFVSRQIAMRLPLNQKLKWKLIDKNKRALKFAKDKWEKKNDCEFLHTDIRRLAIGSSNLSFSTFSSLEFLVDEEIAKSISASLLPNGLLVWIIPDALQDLLEEKNNIYEKLTELNQKGFFSIQKKKKLHELKDYPFLVQRSEIFVEHFLNHQLTLEGLERITASNEKTLFIYKFRKLQNSVD